MTADTLTRDYVSWSELSTYQRCPLQHYFRYVKRVPKEFVASSLIFGGAFHSALEAYYRRLLQGDPVMSVDELLEEFWASWKARAEEEAPVKFGKQDDESAMGGLAKKMLRAFTESRYSQVEGSIIGVEEELRGSLIPGCPDLLARIDLIIDGGEELNVRDFKTARSRWSQSTAEAYGEQILLYSQLASRLAPDRNLCLEFLVTTKAKTPSVELYQIRADPSRIARTINVAKRIHKSVSSGAVYPNPGLMNCHSCPYQVACSQWCG